MITYNNIEITFVLLLLKLFFYILWFYNSILYYGKKPRHDINQVIVLQEKWGCEGETVQEGGGSRGDMGIAITGRTAVLLAQVVKVCR